MSSNSITSAHHSPTRSHHLPLNPILQHSLSNSHKRIVRFLAPAGPEQAINSSAVKNDTISLPPEAFGLEVHNLATKSLYVIKKDPLE